MNSSAPGIEAIDRKVIQLFALVTEALARATHALLSGDAMLGQAVVDGDQAVDDLTAEVELLVWEELQDGTFLGHDLRYLVAMLLIIPELERSADLAEHIAQRAVDHLGPDMSARSRGIIQLMTEVANEMWMGAADAFGQRTRVSERMAQADDEMDILHDDLTREVAREEMPAKIAAQVTLLARFYERLGDHAVNLARRTELLSETTITSEEGGTA
ncbi:MAG TPA: PhoU domain-containing protein [Acidimicrobiales bacterium]|jgi:phosphate transport system protein|nr:PhoU domain-containing protein [Acidimicrobiales bacterium]